VRATLEAITYQVRDVLDIMIKEAQLELKTLKVDGGAVQNSFMMQFQADLLQVPVVKPVVIETTALGASFLAGLAVGFWQDQHELAEKWQIARIFTPKAEREQVDALYRDWKRAVERARGWIISE
jgi:glycerol kinase